MKKIYLVFGKSGFVARSLKEQFDLKNINLIFISSKNIDLSKSSSKIKLKNLFNKYKQINVLFLSALTPDKGKGLDTFELNLNMIINLCQSIPSEKLNHFIYFSSDAVFSLGNKKITDKSIPSPEDLYGLMHFTREKICLNTIDPQKLLILRPTIIYGYGDTHNSYGPNRFIKSALKDKEIKIFNNGKDIRNHLYINDLVSYIKLSISKKIIGAFNLASSFSVSFNDVAKIIKKELMKKNIKIKIINIKTGSRKTERYFSNLTLVKKLHKKNENIEKNIKNYIERILG